MELIVKRFEDLNTVELYEILRLRSEIFVVEQSCIYQDIDQKDRYATHMFYMDDRNIVAYLRILDRGQRFDCVSIGRLVVKSEFRLKGIAQTLIKEALNYIKTQLNESTVKISAQSHLENFYSQLGFKSCSEIYLEDGIKHVEMKYEKILKYNS